MNKVDPDSIRSRLGQEAVPWRTVELFQRFGETMFHETQDRGANLDNRSISLLGWSGAILAFLAAGDPLGGLEAWGFHLLHLAATVAGVMALLNAYRAVRIREWKIPSQTDWFFSESWDDPIELQKYHVCCLMDAVQDASRTLNRKGRIAHLAERSLAVAAGLVALLLAARFFAGPLPSLLTRALTPLLDCLGV